MTEIISIEGLAKFIQNGGGDCWIGSLTIDFETALKRQEQGCSIARDSSNPDRYVVAKCSMATYDYLLGGDWRIVKLEREPDKHLDLVNFFDSLADVNLYAYDVEQWRVAKYFGSLVSMDHAYGGNWFKFTKREPKQIAMFYTKTKEQNIELN
jgi:hypothetical protein